MARTSLDCRNLLCPMPVIRVQAAVAKLAAGDELAVYATDPGALQDIPAWCRVHGHAVASSEERDGEIRLLVRVAGAPCA